MSRTILTIQSDYSRSQYTEKYIQERVALELAKLEEKVKKEFAETADKALLKNTESGLSVPKINDKIQKLNDVLKANAELAKVDLSEEVKNSRNEVIKCLKENEGKSLNCWNEVENFKRVVKDL